MAKLRETGGWQREMGGEAKSDCGLAKRDGGLSYERWAAKPREMGD